MPLDKEIHFGFIGSAAIVNAAAALGIRLYDEETGTPLTATTLTAPSGWIELDTKPIDTLIEEAYEAIASRLGWSLVMKTANNHYIYNTPKGERETVSFNLHIQFDTNEVGDEDEDITMGLNLSARYYPTVLDGENVHGGLGPTIDIEALMPTIAICKEEIIKRLPAFQDAKIIIRDIFY